MTIKQPSHNEITVETQSQSVKVSFLDSIKININDSLVEKPGEYEINNVYVQALEVPNPDYVGVVDFAGIRMENLDLGCIFTDKATNKEFLKDVANIDILIISAEVSAEAAKKALTYFEPQYLIVLANKDVESIKKEYNLPNFVEEKSLKLKESDFPRGENIILRPIILK